MDEPVNVDGVLPGHGLADGGTVLLLCATPILAGAILPDPG